MLPRCSGFDSITILRPSSVRPRCLINHTPGAATSTATPMIPYSCRLVNKNMPWIKS